MMARSPWSSHAWSRRLEFKALCDDMGGGFSDLDLGYALLDIPVIHDATCYAHFRDCLVFVSFDFAVLQTANLDTDTDLDSVRVRK
jgi:hypothetical protein